MKPWGVLYYYDPNNWGRHPGSYYVFCLACWNNNSLTLREVNSKSWPIYSDQLHGLRVRCYYGDSHVLNPDSSLVLSQSWDSRTGLNMGIYSQHRPGNVIDIMEAIEAGDGE